MKLSTECKLIRWKMKWYHFLAVLKMGYYISLDARTTYRLLKGDLNGKI